MAKKEYPTKDPRPGHVWIVCTMCNGEGEVLSRWSAGADSAKIRCPSCFRAGWVQAPIESAKESSSEGKQKPSEETKHTVESIIEWLEKSPEGERSQDSRTSGKSERDIHGANCNCKACKDLRKGYARAKQRWRPVPFRRSRRNVPELPQDRSEGESGKGHYIAGIILLMVGILVALGFGVFDTFFGLDGESHSTNESISTPAPTPTENSVDSNLRHLEEKLYMLELINEERTKRGLQPVVLGDNVAVQLHAESALENCFSSHWDLDGLKPYMRYSLAGGYQSNAENGRGLDYCIKWSDWYSPIKSIKEEISDAMHSWMNSPGHRKNILRSWHRKVNIGLAWNKYNFYAFQHFEGDYVEFDQPPIIEDGVLSLSGIMKNGVSFEEDLDLGIQLYYDPPARSLTPGQLSRTYCYTYGPHIVSLRPPLREDWFYSEDYFVEMYETCPDPYEIPSDIPAPISPRQANRLWQEAYDESKSSDPVSVTVTWITASEWTARGDVFSVRADIGHVLNEYGNGVYSIVVWAPLDGEEVIVSEYSLFLEGI